MDDSIGVSRESAGDVKITIEANGEKYALYVRSSAIKVKTKEEILEALNDPISCFVCCSQKSGFEACMVRCVEGDGKCCDSGMQNCTS